MGVATGRWRAVCTQHSQSWEVWDELTRELRGSPLFAPSTRSLRQPLQGPLCINSQRAIGLLHQALIFGEALSLTGHWSRPDKLADAPYHRRRRRPHPRLRRPSLSNCWLRRVVLRLPLGDREPLFSSRRNCQIIWGTGPSRTPSLPALCPSRPEKPLGARVELLLLNQSYEALTRTGNRSLSPWSPSRSSRSRRSLSATSPNMAQLVPLLTLPHELPVSDWSAPEPHKTPGP